MPKLTSILPQPSFSQRGETDIKKPYDQFQVDMLSGSPNYRIPLLLTPARGLEPELSIAYHAGTQNSIVGMGFDLSMPKISRSTQTNIPCYDNNKDIFTSQWGELVESSEPIEIEQSDTLWLTRYYQARQEGHFTLIEFWENATDKSQSYWIAKTGDGIHHTFGLSSDARVFDLENNTRIFEWALEETKDAKGNKVKYVYEKTPEESNHYLAHILYGNYIDKNTQKARYAFTVTLDYGALPASQLQESPVSAQAVQARTDLYISYRSGFLIQTSRLCRNILLIHQFPHVFNDTPFLVKTWELEYHLRELIQSHQLKSVIQYGYKKLNDGSYLKKALSPIQFEYTAWDLPQDFQNKTIQLPDTAEMPGQLSPFRFVDLYQEGLPGILYSDDFTSLFWRNKGDGSFEIPLELTSFPTDRNLGSRRCQLMTFPENDQMALVVAEETHAGFYGSLGEDGWENYQSFEQYTTDFIDPNAEFVDINGRGYSDLVLFSHSNPYYYPSKGKKGFEEAKDLELPADFPRHQFTHDDEVITFANIFGDGLQHRVRVTQNQLECWPNLGNGHFGEKSVLTLPDLGDDFDARCVFLADTNGTGSADLIYVTSEKMQIYFNFQGKAFSVEPICIDLPELYTHFDQIRLVDLFGKGFSCLVFTKVETTVKHYFYDFSPKERPFLLKIIKNGFGLETTLSYTSSVGCYTADRLSGRVPRYKCLFPVPVLESVVHTDAITQLAVRKRYQFHDGYYEPLERSFVGFAFVEHWDSEGILKELDAPPSYTKLWHHVGGLPRDCQISCYSDSSKSDFYCQDRQAWLLSDSVLEHESVLPQDEEKKKLFLRQARFALRGSVLRIETYGLDSSNQEKNPYFVKIKNYTLRCLMSPNDIKKGVFSSLERESLTYDYERNPDDPRIHHTLNLAWDDYNHVLKACEIYYPRRGEMTADAVLKNDLQPYQEACENIYPEQKKTTILVQIKRVNARIFSPDSSFQFLGIPQENYAFEIFATKEEEMYSWNEMSQLLPRESVTNGNLLHRQIYYYWNEAKNQAIELPDDDAIKLSFPLLHHSETFVATAVQLLEIYERKFNPIEPELNEILSDQSGYILREGSWWKPSDMVHYDPAQFYLPVEVKSFETIARNHSLYSQFQTQYDDYSLIPIRTLDYLQGLPILNETLETLSAVEIDYHVCAPRKVIDPNLTSTEVLYDPLGVIVASAKSGSVNEILMGNGEFSEPDLLLRELNDLTPEMLLSNIPHYLGNAGSILVYRLYHATNALMPACFVHIMADEFQYGLEAFPQNINARWPTGGIIKPIQEVKTQQIIIYYDGLGDAVQVKKNVKANPDDLYNVTQWLSSGYTVLNNKGLTIKQYLPYYTSNILYENESQALTQGHVNPTCMHYDALGRIIRTDTPKGFYTKTQWGAWYEQDFDENDTYLDSFYYTNPARTVEEIAIFADLTIYQDTPHVKVLNPQGKVSRSIEVHRDTYESSARLLISTTIFDVLNRPLSHQDARLALPNITFVYDKLGQILVEDSVDQGKKIQIYNLYGNVILQWNSRNYQFKFEYDNWQRPTIKQVNGGDDAYNVAGYLCYESLEYGDLRPIPAAQQHNLYGQIVKHADQSGLSEFTLFDIQGNSLDLLRRVHLSHGLTKIHWAFDHQGNIQAYDQEHPEVIIDLSLPNNAELFFQRMCFDAIGKIIEHQQCESSIYHFSYNAMEQLDGVILTPVVVPDVPDVVIINHIDYSPNGKVENIIYGNGMESCYIYEATTQHLLKLETKHALKLKPFQDVTYQHDPKGNIIDMLDRSYEQLFDLMPSREEPAALSSSTYKYDSLYRLKSASSRAPRSSFFQAQPALAQRTPRSTSPIFRNTLETIHEDSEFLAASRETFEYDNGHNLNVHRKNADDAPDVLLKSLQTLTVQDNSNRLQREEENIGDPPAEIQSDVIFNYDTQGNLTNSQANTILVWNHLNQLALFTKRNETEIEIEEFYSYAASGRRVRKFTKNYALNTITETVYLKGYELKRERDFHTFEIMNDHTSMALRIYDDQRCIATYRKGYNASQEQPLTYHLGNHLRSVAVEVDNDAIPKMITYEEFSAFGETTFLISIDEQGAINKTLRYSKEEYDESSGFYYYGARYFYPKLGRWLSTDPAGLVDGLNIYGFVGNNPINFWDYWGLSTIQDDFTKVCHALGKKLGEANSSTTVSNANVKTKSSFFHDILYSGKMPEKFEKEYRAKDAGTDEHFQTAGVRELLKGYLNAGGKYDASLADALDKISGARLTTGATGFGEQHGLKIKTQLEDIAKKGTIKVLDYTIEPKKIREIAAKIAEGVQHVTSTEKGGLFHKSKPNAKKSYQVNSSDFHDARDIIIMSNFKDFIGDSSLFSVKHVQKLGELAASATLGMVPTPWASNSDVITSSHDEFHAMREDVKKKFSLVTGTQKHDAPHKVVTDGSFSPIRAAVLTSPNNSPSKPKKQKMLRLKL